MWVKMLCVYLIAGPGRANAEDSMLAGLYGEQGLNRMVICSAGREECEGALLAGGAGAGGQWVAARRGCLRRRARAALRVLPRAGPDHCKDVVTGFEVYLKSVALGVYSNNARRVSSRLFHPTLDFGLIRLDRPYHHTDRLANGTNMDLVFQQNGLWKWMNRILEEHSAAHSELQAPTHTFRLNSNPFLLCFVSMVLPFALFALLFVYVIFYTGTPDEPQYMNHQYIKETSEE